MSANSQSQASNRSKAVTDNSHSQACQGTEGTEEAEFARDNTCSQTAGSVGDNSQSQASMESGCTTNSNLLETCQGAEADDAFNFSQDSEGGEPASDNSQPRNSGASEGAEPAGSKLEKDDDRLNQESSSGEAELSSASTVYDLLYSLVYGSDRNLADIQAEYVLPTYSEQVPPVFVYVFDPGDVWHHVGAAFVKQLFHMDNFEWKGRKTRGLNFRVECSSIPMFDIERVKQDSSLLDVPCLFLHVIECDSRELYNSSVRPDIKRWLTVLKGLPVEMDSVETAFLYFYATDDCNDPTENQKASMLKLEKDRNKIFYSIKSDSYEKSKKLVHCHKVGYFPKKANKKMALNNLLLNGDWSRCMFAICESIARSIESKIESLRKRLWLLEKEQENDNWDMCAYVFLSESIIWLWLQLGQTVDAIRLYKKLASKIASTRSNRIPDENLLKQFRALNARLFKDIDEPHIDVKSSSVSNSASIQKTDVCYSENTNSFRCKYVMKDMKELSAKSRNSSQKTISSSKNTLRSFFFFTNREVIRKKIEDALMCPFGIQIYVHVGLMMLLFETGEYMEPILLHSHFILNFCNDINFLKAMPASHLAEEENFRTLAAPAWLILCCLDVLCAFKKVRERQNISKKDIFVENAALESEITEFIGLLFGILGFNAYRIGLLNCFNSTSWPSKNRLLSWLQSRCSFPGQMWLPGLGGANALDESYTGLTCVDSLLPEGILDSLRSESAFSLVWDEFKALHCIYLSDFSRMRNAKCLFYRRALFLTTIGCYAEATAVCRAGRMLSLYFRAEDSDICDSIVVTGTKPLEFSNDFIQAEFGLLYSCLMTLQNHSAHATLAGLSVLCIPGSQKPQKAHALTLVGDAIRQCVKPIHISDPHFPLLSVEWADEPNALASLLGGVILAANVKITSAFPAAIQLASLTVVFSRSSCQKCITEIYQEEKRIQNENKDALDIDHFVSALSYQEKQGSGETKTLVDIIDDVGSSSIAIDFFPKSLDRFDKSAPFNRNYKGSESCTCDEEKVVFESLNIELHPGVNVLRLLEKEKEWGDNLSKSQRYGIYSIESAVFLLHSGALRIESAKLGLRNFASVVSMSDIFDLFSCKIIEPISSFVVTDSLPICPIKVRISPAVRAINMAVQSLKAEICFSDKSLCKDISFTERAVMLLDDRNDMLQRDLLMIDEVAAFGLNLPSVCCSDATYIASNLETRKSTNGSVNCDHGNGFSTQVKKVELQVHLVAKVKVSDTDNVSTAKISEVHSLSLELGPPFLVTFRMQIIEDKLWSFVSIESNFPYPVQIFDPKLSTFTGLVAKEANEIFPKALVIMSFFKELPSVEDCKDDEKLVHSLSFKYSALSNSQGGGQDPKCTGLHKRTLPYKLLPVYEIIYVESKCLSSGFLKMGYPADFSFSVNQIPCSKITVHPWCSTSEETEKSQFMSDPPTILKKREDSGKFIDYIVKFDRSQWLFVGAERGRVQPSVSCMIKVGLIPMCLGPLRSPTLEFCTNTHCELREESPYVNVIC